MRSKLRITLGEMWHPHTATPIVVDNSTYSGFENDMIEQKWSNTINTKHYWIRDLMKMVHSHVLWIPVDKNWADYVTTHHSLSHYDRKQQIYLHVKYVANNATCTLMRGYHNSGIRVSHHIPTSVPHKCTYVQKGTNILWRHPIKYTHRVYTGCATIEQPYTYKRARDPLYVFRICKWHDKVKAVKHYQDEALLATGPDENGIFPYAMEPRQQEWSWFCNHPPPTIHWLKQ